MSHRPRPQWDPSAVTHDTAIARRGRCCYMNYAYSGHRLMCRPLPVQTRKLLQILALLLLSLLPRSGCVYIPYTYDKLRYPPPFNSLHSETTNLVSTCGLLGIIKPLISDPRTGGVYEMAASTVKQPHISSMLQMKGSGTADRYQAPYTAIPSGKQSDFAECNVQSAFDSDPGSFYTSKDVYDAAGCYAHRPVTSTLLSTGLRISGEWIQLKLPTAVGLISYQLLGPPNPSVRGHLELAANRLGGSVHDATEGGGDGETRGIRSSSSRASGSSGRAQTQTTVHNIDDDGFTTDVLGPTSFALSSTSSSLPPSSTPSPASIQIDRDPMTALKKEKEVDGQTHKNKEEDRLKETAARDVERRRPVEWYLLGLPERARAVGYVWDVLSHVSLPLGVGFAAGLDLLNATSVGEYSIDASLPYSVYRLVVVRVEGAGGLYAGAGTSTKSKPVHTRCTNSTSTLTGNSARYPLSLSTFNLQGYPAAAPSYKRITEGGGGGGGDSAGVAGSGAGRLAVSNTDDVLHQQYFQGKGMIFGKRKLGLPGGGGGGEAPPTPEPTSRPTSIPTSRPTGQPSSQQSQQPSASSIFGLAKPSAVPTLRPIAAMPTTMLPAVPPTSQLTALSRFYTDMGGDTWTVRANFAKWSFSLEGDPVNSAEVCTSWVGITCSTTGDVTGIALNNMNLVGKLNVETLKLFPGLEALQLKGNSLTGPVPDLSASGMPALKYLELSSNKLVGPLPNKFPASLIDLRLSNNSLVGGVFPAGLSTSSNLETIDLGNMGLTGVFPLDFFTKLPKLSAFSVVTNRLKGKPLESICACPGLTIFKLSGNLFDGSFPQNSSLLAEMVNMDTFQIQENSFSGSLPAEMGSWSKLRILSLNDNNFSGDVSKALVNKTNLEQLFLQKNRPEDPACEAILSKVTTEFIKDRASNPNAMPNTTACASGFTSGLPSKIFTLMPALKSLDVSINSFLERLPEELSLLPNLPSISFSGNRFYGQMSSFMLSPSASKNDILQAIDFSNNYLEGESLDFSRLTSLCSLILDGNFLSGIFPVLSASARATLRTVRVSNRLRSSNLAPDASMGDLQLCFKGQFPASMNTYTLLQQLEMYNHCLSGPIPTAINTLVNLVSLRLDSNKFNGQIPTLDSLRGLLFLDLRFNDFNGTLPSKFSALTNLKDLYISNNPKLGGSLPDLSGLVNLQAFDASNCMFSGTLPANLFTKMTKLTYVNLARKVPGVKATGFAGSIPLETLLKNNKQLATIDFSNNMFTSVEGIKSSSPQLTSLILASNMLTDDVTSIVGSGASSRLPNLAQLDISGNKIAGTFPVSFVTNSKSLKQVDISANKITSIPLELLSVSTLTVLRVDGNPDMRSGATIKIIGPALTELRIGGTQLAIQTSTSFNHLQVLYADQLKSVTIASDLWTSTNLRFLMLDSSTLLPRPPSLADLPDGKMSSLVELHMARTGLTWDFGTADNDSWYCSPVSNLKSGNSLQGTFPSWMLSEENCPKRLTVINLSKNTKFTPGPAMDPNATLKAALVSLDISSTNRNGELMQFAASSSSVLQSFKIANNAFSGQIPENWATTLGKAGGGLESLTLSSLPNVKGPFGLCSLAQRAKSKVDNKANGVTDLEIFVINDPSICYEPCWIDTTTKKLAEGFHANSSMRQCTTTFRPSPMPSANPTMLPGVPTPNPTSKPTAPTAMPSPSPSVLPSAAPSPDSIALCDFWASITIAANKAKLTNWCGAGDKSSACSGNGGTSSWLGVTCAVVGGSVNRVTKLDTWSLQLWALGGTLPTSIGGLNMLTYLDLGGAGISGPIPSSIGELTGLFKLSLPGNSLSGIIPSSIGALTGLADLWLYTNALTGRVPDSFCNLQPTIDMAVQSNPGLTCYPSCLSFFSNFNKGSLSAVCAGVPSSQPTSMPTPFPSANPTMLPGVPTPTPTSKPTLAPSLAPSPDNTALCDFYNTIPAAANRAKLVNWCGTGDGSSVCGAAGTSSWLGVACAVVGGVSRVTKLDTCQYTASSGCTGVTSFGGSLPTSIGDLDELIVLELAFAGLSGSIPSSLGSLSKLTLLSLSSSSFVGIIPSSLAALTGLDFLALGANSLSGTIPSLLGGLTRLNWLNLEANSLSGTIPTTLGDLAGLTLLQLSGNSLSGSIPSSFCSLQPTIDLQVLNNPGLTCYPQCLSSYSKFVSSKGSLSAVCTAAPSSLPSALPTFLPSPLPSAVPSANPTMKSDVPTPHPTARPTAPSAVPSAVRSPAPSAVPTVGTVWSCPSFAANDTRGGTINFQTCGVRVCNDTSLVLSTCEAAGGSCSGTPSLFLYSPDDTPVPYDSKKGCGRCLEYRYTLSAGGPGQGSCADYVLRQGCASRDGACNGKVAAVGAALATSMVAFAPTAAPVVGSQSQGSAAPSAVPTSPPVLAQTRSDFSAIGDVRFSITTTVVLVAVLLASVIVGYFIFHVRAGVEEAALAASSETEPHKRRLKDGLVSFGRFDLLFSLPLAAMTFTSNILQVSAHFADGSSGRHALGLAVLLSRLGNACVGAYVLHAALYRPWLMCYLHGKLLHKGTVWVAVSAVVLLDPSQLRLLPWRFTEFSHRSGGYPCLFPFQLTLVATIATNLVSVIVAALSLLLLDASAASFALSFVSFAVSVATVAFRIQAEKIHTVSSSLTDAANELWVKDLELQETIGELRRKSALMKETKVEMEELKRKAREASETAAHAAAALGREKTKLFDSNVKYADETLDVVKEQLRKKGEQPLEYIPLDELNAELAALMDKANAGEAFDERRMEHLLQCMELNPTYQQQKEADLQAWRDKSEPYAQACLELTRGFVPPSIFPASKESLVADGVPIALAKRLLQKKCLWLVRMPQQDIEKLHVADLFGRYGTDGQGLDIVEMAALYAHVPRRLPNDPLGKKADWARRLESQLKDMMRQEAEGSLAAAKRRCPAYKGCDPPYAERLSMFSQQAVLGASAVGGGGGDDGRDSFLRRGVQRLDPQRKTSLLVGLGGATGNTAVSRTGFESRPSFSSSPSSFSSTSRLPSEITVVNPMTHASLGGAATLSGRPPDPIPLPVSVQRPAASPHMAELQRKLGAVIGKRRIEGGGGGQTGQTGSL